MGIIEDTMKALERIPLWKRVVHLPDEVAALRARIEAIEKRLEGKSGIACPACKSLDFKVISSAPDPVFVEAGIMRDLYRCSSCSHEEVKMRDIGSQVR